MKQPFFQRYALLILMVTFFLVPFGLRGARMAIRGMRNDVKDWLPDDFDETTELEWFRERFTSNAFVVVSWDGCTGTLDDQRFRVFLNKFYPETPPSRRPVADTSDPTVPQPDEFADENLGLYNRQFVVDKSPARQEFIGNQRRLYATVNDYHDWGGQDEKWLRGEGQQWYYILPNGDLHRWGGMDTLIGKLLRGTRRLVTGKNAMHGTLVASLGYTDGPWYYQDLRRLEADLFETVITGPSVMSDLTCEGGELEGEPAAAMGRLKGLLFGPDGQQTCFLISLTDFGRDNLHRVVGRGLLGRPRGKLLSMAEEAGLHAPPVPSLLPPPLNRWFASPVQLTGPIFRMGGGAVDNVAIDEEGQATLVRLVGLSVVLGLVISWLSFRSLSVTLLLFFVGGAAAVASLGLVWWSGGSMDAVLMSMPSLVYVLGLSGAVHIVNYYRDTIDKRGFPGSPGEALRLGWKPCSLAALTTAIGLASLSTSNVVPIRKFGIFSALAVLAALSLVFFFLPAGLNYWPPDSFRRDERSKAGGRGRFIELIGAFWRSLGELIIRRHAIVTVVCLIFMVICAFGVPKINTSVQLMKLFHQKAKIIEDYHWLESNLGKLVPMEVVVRVDPDMIRRGDLPDSTVKKSDSDEKFRLSFLERIEIIQYIREAIEAKFGSYGDGIVGQSMSALSFVRQLPAPGGGSRQSAARSTFSRRLATHRKEILGSDYFRIEEADQSELWRLSLRVGALNDVDYGRFVGDLKTAVEPVMAAYRYREKVLRSLDERSGGDGYRGERVLLLGIPGGPSKYAKTPLQSSDPEDDAAVDAATAEQIEVNQLTIFVRYLHRLLRNSGISARDWHDPRFELPDNWADGLERQFDCVVKVQDDPRYEVLDDHPELLVVDACDFAFHPGDVISSAALQQEASPVSVVYTGLVPVVYKAQRTLLQSLNESTGWAFLAISLVMIVVLRNVKAGMVSMVPNVFPVVIIFGLMGWWDVLVDIGTMMTASVAMGVAVDDTIHFLTWFRRGLDDGLDRHASIRLAYDRCATAMTQTTLIAGLGLSVFGLSTFTPTQHFGILMLTLMAAALVGDLVFLPAILAGPFGRIFEKKKRSAVKSPAQGPHREQTGDVTAADGSTAKLIRFRGRRERRPVGPDRAH